MSEIDYGDHVLHSTEAEAPVSPEQARYATLTEREAQVAKALALGSTNREVAKALDVSVKTIDTHRGHLLKKLGTRNNAELARFMIGVGAVARP